MLFSPAFIHGTRIEGFVHSEDDFRRGTRLHLPRVYIKIVVA